MRRAGVRAELAYDAGTFRKHLRKANAAGMAYVVLVGPEEVLAATARIKNLETREERTVPVDKVVATLGDQGHG